MRRNTGQLDQYLDNHAHSRQSRLSDAPSTFLVPKNTFSSSSTITEQSSISRKRSSISMISGMQQRRFAQNMRRLQNKYKHRKTLEAQRRASILSNQGIGHKHSRQDLQIFRRHDSSVTIESEFPSFNSRFKAVGRSDKDLREKLEVVQFQSHITKNSKTFASQPEINKVLPLNQIAQINEDLVMTPRLSRMRVQEETGVKYEFDLEEGKIIVKSDEDAKSVSIESDSSDSAGSNIPIQTLSYESRRDLSKQVNRLRELNKYGKCLILPDDPWAIRWNFILICVIILSSITIPLRAAFFEEESIGWYLLEGFIDIVYFLDIVLTFFSAYYNKIEVLIYKRRQIACGYLKTWFILDVISVIPLSLFITSSSNKFGKIVKLPRIYQIVKTTKFVRVIKAVKASSRFKRNVPKPGNIEVERLMLFLFVFVLLCHNLSCLWFLVAKIQDFHELTWVSRYDLTDAPIAQQYLASLYFIVTTITTVGYGDITSKSPAEQGFCIILMLIGVISYTMAISSFTSLISDSNRQQKQLVSKLNVLSLLREEYNLSLDLYWRLRQSLHYEHSMDMSEKQDFVKELPPKLRVELSNIMYTHQLNGVRFFEKKSAEFVAAIAPKLKPVKACKGDYLFIKGDALDGIYFIKQGEASYVQRCAHADLIFATNRPGSYFGDIEFSMIDESAEPTRFFSVKARQDLDLLFLPKEDLYEIDNHFRKEVLSLFDRSLSHLDKLKNMNRKSEVWLEKRYSAYQSKNPSPTPSGDQGNTQTLESDQNYLTYQGASPRHEQSMNDVNCTMEPIQEERTRKTLKEDLEKQKIAYQARKSRKKTMKLQQKEAIPRGITDSPISIQNAFQQFKPIEERKAPSTFNSAMNT